jgi:predicted nucleic acid-binding Zn ribbon protein
MIAAMRKCPHCGEIMSKGQEICFACGQHFRERAHRGERPHNPLVFVFAGVLVLAVLVGIVIMISGRAKRTSSEAYRQKQAQIEEAARAEAQAKRDSARAAVRNDATGMLVQEVNDLESRFNLVRREVVDKQPSPSQAKLISQISSEVARLRQLTATIASQTGAASDSLKEELRDGERLVRSLISALSRAPKK